MKLLVGLGNPGEKYARTRHNIGFMAVEAIAARHKFSPWKKKFQGYAADGEIAGEKVLLLKPETYMNESGRSVGEAARFLKVAPADIIVFHDELDLAPGKLKIKTGGGNAGHNGLRSISAHVSNEFVRVRMGIGHPGSKDAVVHFVLHDFAKADADWLRDLLDAVADASPRLAAGDQVRFLTDVALKLGAAGSEPEPRPAKLLPPRTPPPADAAPAARPASGSGRHPAGERGNKRQSAIAENLKKWLAAKDGKAGGNSNDQ